MHTRAPHRLPISTRHAFALAFDLALRRDLLHSMILPWLLRAPWLVAYAVVPTLLHESHPARLTIPVVGLVGDFLVSLVVGAMLRIRARSVFNTPPDVKPIPASVCYALGLRRVPWLIVTEIVRNVALTFAWSFSIMPAVLLRLREQGMMEDLARTLILVIVAGLLVLPAVFLGFRLAVATESVVLHEHDLADAFIRSFRMTRGRFERWLELTVASTLLVLAVLVVAAALTVAVPALGTATGIGVLFVLATSLIPLIQYAWAFFYLRLDEIDEAEAEADAPGPSSGDPVDRTPRLEVVRSLGEPGTRSGPEA